MKIHVGDDIKYLECVETEILYGVWFKPTLFGKYFSLQEKFLGIASAASCMPLTISA